MSASNDSNSSLPDPMTIDPANLGSVDPLSVEGIFLVALSKTGLERDAFLSAQCADTSQRQRVEGLLLAYEQAGNFLQKPAVAAEATPIGQYLEQCPLPGTLGKLGPYEILEEIGRGGMGVVFRAHDPKLQRIVAVKALAPELARLPSARQRFLREARAAAAISHPHVVTIFAVEGTEEASLGTERTTLPFLVMECIVGQTLHDKIKRVGALKVEEIIRISRQIAEGLTAAHKRGLIHRDIKPANILLENGVERVKITDFGLARTTSDGGITHTGEILGTPQCMSPEQARGEIVDQRSDLFSLGCVMYTMCTGVSPFRADNMLAVMKKVCEETPTQIAQLNPGIPEWLCRLIHSLLEKLPESRIQSAEEVVQFLESRATLASRTAPKTTPAAAAPTADLSSAAGNVFAQWHNVLWSVGSVSTAVGWMIGKDRYDLWAILPAAVALVWGILWVIRKTIALHWAWIQWRSFVVSMLTALVASFLRQWDTSDGYRRGGFGLFADNLFEAAVYILPAMLGFYWVTQLQFGYLAELERKKRLTGEGASDGHLDHRQSPSTAPKVGFGFTTNTLILVALLTGGIAAHQLLSKHGSQENAAMAMFFLVIALMLWLVIRFCTIVVRRTRALEAFRASALANPLAAQRARTPWVLLEWIIVGTLGIAIMLSLGFATILIMPYLPTPDEIGPRAYLVIRTPVAENLKYVTVDGKRAVLEPGGPGEWRVKTTSGIRGVYVAYDNDSVLNQERFFTTTASVDPGRTKIIMAEPVMIGSLIRPPGIEAPMSVQTGRMRIPTEIPSDQTSTRLPINHDAIPTEVTASIPLADAVEILTERASTPVASYSARDEVWIDEPGLIIRMRRESFEGLEEEQLEYCSNVTWGEGRFIRPKDNAEVTDIPAGRYQVLVQDLDYGWPLDRRGTITIGNELTVVHVKRSFQTHRLQSSGADRFPMSFRWAGKRYQIDTPDDVQIVNGLLAATAEKQNYVVPESFRTHPLFVEAVNIDTQGGGHSLKHHRILAQIDVQSSDMLVGFRSPLGVLAWNQKCVSPGGVFVPTQGLEMFVTDRLFGWGINGWIDHRPIAMDESLAMPLVARRDRGFIKRFSDAPPENSSVNGTAFHFRWFDEGSFIKPKSLPVVQRLVAAWADGQPDVPEAELLQLGEASSWKELWREESPEGSAVSSGPRFLSVGSTPGTWRMKEPPEGAVAPN